MLTFDYGVHATARGVTVITNLGEVRHISLRVSAKVESKIFYFTDAGMSGPETYTITYTLESDCVLTVEITFGSGQVLHEVGTITGEGRFQEVHNIATDPGFVFSDTAKKQ